ncbi:hypothetical protein AAFC00_004673 [Neodothiora populina]|uniref:Cytochrome b561 domain-containing protein n=1 Tax=Neodothiora populina TaxID=2781224 RepID=A0ABR3P398_9PEZI
MIIHYRWSLTSPGSVAFAQYAQSCNSDNVCFSLNIPDATASSGSGDIYMQISAPTSYSWVALGQGSQMAGAQMFVLYTDASGTNVTLSPRLSTGHSMPTYNSAAQVTLLDGTGVSNGVMTANFRCSSCSSWSGGDMDFTSSSGNFIYATRTGSGLDSDSPSASISQHNNHNDFQFDFTEARGGDSINPFTSGTAATSASGGAATASNSAAASSSCVSRTASSTIAAPSGSGCPTAWPTAWSSSWPSSRPTQYASCFSGRGYGSWPTAAPYVKAKRDDDSDGDDDDSVNYCDSSSGNSGSGSSSSSSSSGSSGSSGSSFNLDSNGVPFGGDFNKARHVMIAHGVMAALAWVILFPFGSISIRSFSFPGLIWFHAIFQSLAYLVYIAAFGLGIYLAQNTVGLNQAHPIIGIVIFILVFFQPFLGFLHHKFFKTHSRRTVWSYGHIWLGRILITLAMINGGLGLQLSANSRTGEIAYGVIAGVVWVAYVASIIYGERKRKRTAPPSYGKSMQMERSRSSSGSPTGPREWYGKGRN